MSDTKHCPGCARKSGFVTDLCEPCYRAFQSIPVTPPEADKPQYTPLQRAIIDLYRAALASGIDPDKVKVTFPRGYGINDEEAIARGSTIKIDGKPLDPPQDYA